jgi:hypothetical protein
VQGTLLAAAISPDNTPHGYNLTFAFPMLMFIIIATALYLRFRSPHRVPGSTPLILASAQAPSAQTPSAPASETTHGSTLHEGTAHEGSAHDGTGPDGTVTETTESTGTAEGSE